MAFEIKQSPSFEFDRSLNLVGKLVIVDGLIGGGKNLLSSIISSLPSVEHWIHKPQIEQICGLYHFNHISLNAFRTLVNTWLTEEVINLSISRNTNFKPADHSSIFRSDMTLKYLKRLFISPKQALECIKNETPILNLMTHVNTSYAKPLFETLDSRLVYVRVTRHPMTTYMIRHNAKWTDRWGIDERHGHLLYKVKNHNGESFLLPHYAKNIENKYLKSNSTERAIYLFDEWIRKEDQFIDHISKSTNAKIIEVPYEKFVFNPLFYIEKIAVSLGTTIDKATIKRMKKEKVPRSSLTDSPNYKIYSDIGWEKPKKDKSLSEEFNEGREFAKKTACSATLSILDSLAKDYEKRHQIKI